MPLAFVGVIAAMVLLVLRRKRNGVRPQRSRTYLITAIALLLFAVIVFAVIPAVDFVYNAVRFGTAVFFAGLKS